MSKYIKFEKVNNEILVKSKKHGELLGKIIYYKPWKQLVFRPIEAIFNDECLMDIQDMLKISNAIKKQNEKLTNPQ